MPKEYEFLTPEKAWEQLQEYRSSYYRANIAAYSGDRNELRATSSNGMFWARDGKCRVHVPVAADIASTSADLLFSEEPNFTTKDIDTEESENDQQKRLDELLYKNNVFGKLNEAAESCAAVGDVYLKLNYSKDELDYPILSVVQGDSAWPEFLLGTLKGIHFFSVINRDLQTGKVTRMYELYQPGKITMAVYSGDETSLGMDTGEIGKYGYQRENKTPVEDMLAVHIPNMKPNRRYRDEYKGRSDFDELRDMMDELDETYSSWLRDIRLAKARLIVPAEYLRRKPSDVMDASLLQTGKYEFDEDVETLVALDIDPDKGQMTITPSQFAIRSSEHLATCTDILRNIYATAGYSPQSFGLDINGLAQSGTALHIREKKSYNTRGKKQTYWKSPLESIVTAMVHLDSALYPDKGSDTDDEVKVKFADSMANDITTMASAVQMLNAANSASIETRVTMMHPDWTKKQVKEETKRLRVSEWLLYLNSGVIDREQFKVLALDDEVLEILDKVQEEEPEEEQISIGEATGQAQQNGNYNKLTNDQQQEYDQEQEPNDKYVVNGKKTP